MMALCHIFSSFSPGAIVTQLYLQGSLGLVFPKEGLFNILTTLFTQIRKHRDVKKTIVHVCM